MDARRILTDEWDGEARALLDALLDPRAATQPDLGPAARLARLGVWRRGNTLPRGTAWAAASVVLPDPTRLGELTARMRSSHVPVQGQLVSALGHWGGESAVSPLVDLLRSISDDTVRLYCVAALRTIGGPSAVAALIDAARTSPHPVAEAALTGLEALLTGGNVEDTSATSSVREAPPEMARAFEAQLQVIQRALEEIGEVAASRPVRTKVRDLLDLLSARVVTTRVVRVTPAKLDALLAELDALPATLPDEFGSTGPRSHELRKPGARVLRFELDERVTQQAQPQIRASLAQADPAAQDAAIEPERLAAAAAGPAEVGNDGTDETLQCRSFFDADGRLVVLLSSPDLTFDGARYRVTVGDLQEECLLLRVSKDQVLGDAKFAFDQWSRLSEDAPVRIERIMREGD